MNFKVFAASAAALALCLSPVDSSAQLGGLGRALGNATSRLNPATALQGKPPITTSLPDAKWGDPGRDGFKPRERKRALTDLQRTPAGGFVLQAGYFEMQTQSYCLQAGTHGPGGGDGYLYAPTAGPAEEAVTTILRNSVNFPDIEQRQIQTLLWAIVARSKFQDLSTEHKAIAARLLTPKQLLTLNRSALDYIPAPLMNAAMNKVPPVVRQALQAEAQLRQMLTTSGTSFAELERVAVLSGMAPRGEGSIDVPSGRWNQHPDGYHIRYTPQGYSHTVVEIWVPEGSAAVGKTYDPATHIAVPGNTSRQRLVQSGRARRT